MNMKTKIYSVSGFSFIEVIVTIFIIGLTLVLYQATLGKMRLIEYAKHQEIALRVANNKMEELRAGGYDALPLSGSFSDSQLDGFSDCSAKVIIAEYNATTKEVAVTVEWREPVSTALRNVTLTTLITKTGGI